MWQEEVFIRAVRMHANKYYSIQIPEPIARVLNLKKGTLVRVKISVAEENVTP